MRAATKSKERASDPHAPPLIVIIIIRAQLILISVYTHARARLVPQNFKFPPRFVMRAHYPNTQKKSLIKPDADASSLRGGRWADEILQTPLAGRVGTGLSTLACV